MLIFFTVRISEIVREKKYARTLTGIGVSHDDPV